MAISVLIKKCYESGIVLYPKPLKRLGYKIPRNIISPALKQKIQENKHEILNHIIQKQIERLILPESWKLALTQTLTTNCPGQINKDKWDGIQTQVYLWGYQNLPQLQKIIADGWAIQNIFGCHNLHPERRTDRMGLLMLIHDNAIEQVNMGAIALKTSSGAEQCFYKNILSSPEDGLIYNLGYIQ